MFRKKSNPLREQELVLLQEIQQVKLSLDAAYSNFENVIDPDLIDCYIYEVNAFQKRYKYLLKQIQNIQSMPSY